MLTRKNTDTSRPIDPHPEFYKSCDLKEGYKRRILEDTQSLVAGSGAGIIHVLQSPPKVKMPLTIPEYFQGFQQQCSGSFVEYLQHNITNGDRDIIEKYTRKQHKSEFWKKQRIGAITSSILHRVVHYSGCDADNYIVKSIMGFDEFQGNAATKYGTRTEVLARNLYAQHIKKIHVDSHVAECGLLISETNPILRATPDGKVSCSCCGTGLLEIKCPYTSSVKKGLNGYDIAKLGNYHVVLDDNGLIKLKLSSPWYTQIQGQLGVSGYPWCDFVMYTKKPPYITIERIHFNKNKYKETVAKAMLFYAKFIVPKL